MKMHSTCLRDKTLSNVPQEVPDGLLNEQQAKINHGQTLARLNERGGLGILEILWNIHQQKIDFTAKETQVHVDELNRLIDNYKSNTNEPD